ncbi:hypothetical protein HPGAM_04325 [Helicobacter pylori Gambia94/24]|nr:hypothetical protein HPGAM_04325 [Helicobacter pylori Gambia94/24]
MGIFLKMNSLRGIISFLNGFVMRIFLLSLRLVSFKFKVYGIMIYFLAFSIFNRDNSIF